MNLRSFFVNALINDEVEAYLQDSDVILVPFGPTELHGGLPLDCETILSEAIALLLAQRANLLILPNIPYIYSGATAIGKGTVQLTARDSSTLINGIAESLLRSGFKKQIYISLHGPAHISISPVVRDFFDRTGTSILYIDGIMAAQKAGLFNNPQEMSINFDKMIVGAYKLRNRLEDVPLTTDYAELLTNTPSEFGYLSKQAFQSSATGYYFKEASDHMATAKIPDAETRERFAKEGIVLLNKLADAIDIHLILEDMVKQENYLKEVYRKYPHVPAVWNQK